MSNTEDKSVAVLLLRGGLLGAGTLVLLTLSVCAVLLKTGLSRNLYLPLLMLSCVFSGIISGFCSARRARKNGLINGLLSGFVPAFFIIVAMTVASKGLSVYQPVVAACSPMGGALGGIAAVNIKSKRKVKKRK